MPKPNQEFAEWQILRTVELQAVATWMLQKIIQRLKNLESAIYLELLQADPDGEAKTPQQRQDILEKLIAAIEELIRRAYQEILKRAEEDFEDLADAENEERRQQMRMILDIRSKKSKGLDMGALLIMGATLEDWLSKQAGDLKFRYDTALSQGFGMGEGTEQLGRRIKGFAGFENKIPILILRPTDTAERHAETVIRTAVEAVEQSVTTEILAKTGDSIRVGWQSIAVLDSRTTQLCRAYAWKIWDRNLKPLGHDLPFLACPRHANCRSTNVVTLLDDDPAKEFTFADWLGTLSTEDQEKIFGKKAIALYKAGKMTDTQLVRQQMRTLSIDDLRKITEARKKAKP